MTREEYLVRKQLCEGLKAWRGFVMQEFFMTVTETTVRGTVVHNLPSPAKVKLYCHLLEATDLAEELAEEGEHLDHCQAVS